MEAQGTDGRLRWRPSRESRVGKFRTKFEKYERSDKVEKGETLR